MDHGEYREKLGKKIAQIRESQRYGKSEFAEECKISRVTLYRIERGTHDVGICILREIAKVVGVPLGELVTID